MSTIMQSYQCKKDPELAEVQKSPVPVEHGTSLTVEKMHNGVGRLYTCKCVAVGLLAVVLFYQLFNQRNIIALQGEKIENLRSVNSAIESRYKHLLGLFNSYRQHSIRTNAQHIQTLETGIISVEEFVLSSKTRNGTFPMYCKLSEIPASDFRFKLFSNLSSHTNNITKFIQLDAKRDNSTGTEVQKRICWIGPENPIDGDEDLESKLLSRQILLPHLLRINSYSNDTVHLIADPASGLSDWVLNTFNENGPIDKWRRGIYDEKQQTFVQSSSSELSSPHFTLISNREIEIQTSGYYTIYAQLTYSISADTSRWIFAIKVNGVPKIRCKLIRRNEISDYYDIVKSIHSTAPKTLEQHSCSTSLTLELSEFDTVEIFCIQGCTTIEYRSNLTYWGIKRLEKEPVAL